MPFKDPEKERDYQNNYRKENGARINAIKRAKYRTNPQKERQRVLKYSKANPQKRRERDYANRAKIRASMRSWYQNGGKKKVAVNQAKYVKTPKGRETKRKASEKHRTNRKATKNFFFIGLLNNALTKLINEKRTKRQ